jgi:hypothetical protein
MSSKIIKIFKKTSNSPKIILKCHAFSKKSLAVIASPPLSLVELKYGGFVSVNLDPSLPKRKLYQNLCGLGVLNAPERLQVEMDGERLNNYF